MVAGVHIVFDCADPDTLARFWMEALEGYDFPFGPPEGHDTWDAWADANGIPESERNRGRTLVDQVSGRPDIFFLRVPEPKVSKNRLHLDVKVGGDGDERRRRIDAKVARLLAIGATVVERFDGTEGFWVVLRDPEHNEFCVA